MSPILASALDLLRVRLRQLFQTGQDSVDSGTLAFSLPAR